MIPITQQSTHAFVATDTSHYHFHGFGAAMRGIGRKGGAAFQLHVVVAACAAIARRDRLRAPAKIIGRVGESAH